MEYKIVIESDTFRLEKEVNKLISKGYIPIGGICKYQTSGCCLQAMIKTI